MKVRFPQIGFPLLGKELVELSARKRTYVARVVYALALFGFFGLFLYDLMRRYGLHESDQFNPAIMGLGRQIFEFVVVMQFAGIFLFLPAMMAGVITCEKERDSLSLLLLTDLRPREILLQKYVSRLIPMLSFLLLSMPLMAMAYSLGGITTHYFWSGIWLLFWCCLQVGAIALMCSAFCRSTVSAIITAYIAGGFFYFSVVILALIQMVLTWNANIGWANDEEVLFMFFTPSIFAETRNGSFHEVVLRSIPVIASTVVFLGLARLFLLRRAFTPARHRVRQFFRWLDRLFVSLNWLTGGRMLGRRCEGDLPGDQPVAWRELSRRSLGQRQHLFRILMALELPLLLILILGWRWWSDSLAAYPMHAEWLTALMFLLWPMAVLIVAVMSVNAVAAERTNQTLNVLLTTPLTGKDIVRQKMRAVRRIVVVLAVPLLTVAMFEALMEGGWNTRKFWGIEYRDPISVDLAASLSTIAIYLPMVAWLGMLIGLKVPSRTRALLTMLGIIIGWCAGWPLVLVIMDQFNIVVRNPPAGWYILSPATMVILSEVSAVKELEMGRWGALVLNCVIYGGALLLLRTLCLRYADRFLGRP